MNVDSINALEIFYLTALLFLFSSVTSLLLNSLKREISKTLQSYVLFFGSSVILCVSTTSVVSNFAPFIGMGAIFIMLVVVLPGFQSFPNLHDKALNVVFGHSSVLKEDIKQSLKSHVKIFIMVYALIYVLLSFTLNIGVGI